MSHTIMVIPTGLGVGLLTIAQGLQRAFINLGIRTHYLLPIDQIDHVVNDQDTQELTALPTDEAISFTLARQYLSANQHEQLLEQIVARHANALNEADVVIVQGLMASQDNPFFSRMNARICKALDAKVILVASPGNQSAQELSQRIEIFARSYGGVGSDVLLGTVINKIDAPTDDRGHFDFTTTVASCDLETWHKTYLRKIPVIQNHKINLLATIPWSCDLMAPRVKDVKTFLNADIIHQGEIDKRRVHTIVLCARSVANMTSVLKAGTLIITAADRHDIIIASCMAALTGIPISALLLTGDYEMDDNVMHLCEPALQSGLPILRVKTDSLRTGIQLQHIDRAVPEDDIERMDWVKNFVAQQIDPTWLKNFLQFQYTRHLSPQAFRYLLTEKAKKSKKNIVLPEGLEPRIIEAAALCAKRGIAHCTLLGDEGEIHRMAEQLGVSLDHNITIIDPSSVSEKYQAPLVKLRKHKGVSDVVAEEMLHDPTVLATMMLQQGDVDGLVSGAIHTTANTIRPALQLIKTAKNTQLVSSIFFMCLPEQVLVYGDCAINPEPDAQQLADIAIQSADSAASFGIEPRIAMISYSTGSSGKGQGVDKVSQATDIVKQLRPDLIIDGPLQYDAALIQSVAKSKAPDSPVAGRATVIIFPDLNTGNTTYKAVQRSADVLSIGPMLQGLAKPVNDLSRGALVDDIVYTIALTAIQASTESES